MKNLLNTTERYLWTYNKAYSSAVANEGSLTVQRAPRTRAGKAAFADYSAVLERAGLRQPVDNKLAAMAMDTASNPGDNRQELSYRRRDTTVTNIGMGALAGAGLMLVALTPFLAANTSTTGGSAPNRYAVAAGGDNPQVVIFKGVEDGKPYTGEFTVNLGSIWGPVIIGTEAGADEAVVPDGSYPVWSNQGGPPSSGEDVQVSRTDITVRPIDGVETITVHLPSAQEGTW